MGLLSCCDAWASHHGGFFSCGAQVLGILGMWNHPGPGIKPASPALAGKFLSTEPPGKSCSFPSDANSIYSTIPSEETSPQANSQWFPGLPDLCVCVLCHTITTRPSQPQSHRVLLPRVNLEALHLLLSRSHALICLCFVTN